EEGLRRRHQPRRPPHAAIRPGRPAPAMGPGTATGTRISPTFPRRVPGIALKLFAIACPSVKPKTLSPIDEFSPIVPKSKGPEKRKLKMKSKRAFRIVGLSGGEVRNAGVFTNCCGSI